MKARYQLLAIAVLLIGCTFAGAFQPPANKTDLGQKEFFLPELHLSSSQVALQDIQSSLTTKGAWDDFFQRNGSNFTVFFDPRSNVPVNIIGHVPLIPGTGVDNKVTLKGLSKSLGLRVDQVTPELVTAAFLKFITDNKAALAIDTAQLGQARTNQVTPSLWHISIPQSVNGIPVRWGRFLGVVNHGNLIIVGGENWSNVTIDTKTSMGGKEAMDLGFARIGGRGESDKIWREPSLEIIPIAPPQFQSGEEFTGPMGAGLSHRLAWVFGFQRGQDQARWQISVDAKTGEVLELADQNDYIDKRFQGNTYPLTDTGICPSNDRCGAMVNDSPMPFADTGFANPNDFTNSAGLYNYTGGTATTTLSGKFVDMTDTCSPVTTSSATGDINMGGLNGQHDCTLPAPGGLTSAVRTGYFELNRLFEEARGYLPGNAWLNGTQTGPLPANMNIALTCNAFYSSGDPGSVNFYKSGGGCNNTGEIAAVFDHEWGHGMDDHDTAGALSSSSEGYADIASMYRLWASCVGYGFFQAGNLLGCGDTSDGTGSNNDEALTGPLHCDLDCSGVRDSDWAKHAGGAPDTVAFTCASCTSGGGPCGRQVHCSATPVRQAAWDLVARDLRGAPFNMDANTAFIVGDKVFYQGSGNVGSWHACTCPSTSDGCAAANGYMGWIAADDDNGLLTDGTPHMTAIFAAYNRHGIACAAPIAVNSGCAAGPSAAPTNLVATPGANSVVLTWNTVAGAVSYNVFRGEGFAGCDFGKALIGNTASLTFTDTNVGFGRTYSYVVMAQGTDDACFSPSSTCQQAVPLPGTLAPQVVAAGSSLVTEGCAPSNGGPDPNENVSMSLTLQNVGTSDTTNVVATLEATGGVTNPSSPQTYGALIAGGAAVSKTYSFKVDPGVACGANITITLDLQDGATNLGTAVFTVQSGAAGAPATFSYAGAATPIPDNLPAGVNTTLTVSGFTGNIADLNFSIDGTSCNSSLPPQTTVGIDHSWVGDIILKLTAPNATAVTFVNRAGAGTFGSDGNNFCQTVLDDQSAGPNIDTIVAGGAPYTGSFTPQSPLSAFNGIDPNGIWTLNASDNAAADTGTLRAYSITLTNFACCTSTCPSITLSPSTLPDGTTGAAYSQTVTASGGAAPYTFAVTSGTLPTGLSMDAAGNITGTPTASGTFNFTITATDDDGCTGFQAYTVNITCPTITVAPATLPDGSVGAAYNQTVTASGGTGPYTFAVTSGTLPTGLSMDSAGNITGTPTVAGPFSFTVTATDANSCTGSQAYTVTITTCPVITVAPATLPNGTVGTAYTQTVTASGGTGPYTFAVTSGALPTGTTMDAAGNITGTPTAAGTFNFDITATDANTCTGVTSYSVTISLVCPAITITPATLPNGNVGTAYNQTLTGNGGTGPYTFAVTSGTLPAGLTLDAAGNLTGTPTTTGPSTFDVTATDSNTCTGTITYTITIDPACLFCEEFNGATPPVTWTYNKPGVFTESAGLLHPVKKKKSTAIATPAFAGCQNCAAATAFTSTVGKNKVFLYGWRVDKDNQVELQITHKKVILKQRTNKHIVKKTTVKTTAATTGAPHVVTMTYDGTNLVVNIDGTDVIPTFAPVGTLPSGTVGLGTKGDLGASFDYVHVN